MARKVISMEIGFVGLGAMGLPMASNLIAAGHRLTVWNRTASKADPLVVKGAQRAHRPEDVAHPGAIVVSMLADDAALEAMGEAFAMAEKSGLDRVAMASMLAQTLFACPVYQNYGAAGAERRHSPAGFRLPLKLKDVELVLGNARWTNTPMLMASLLRDRFVHALAMGREDLDWSAMALGAAEDAGLKS